MAAARFQRLCRARGILAADLDSPPSIAAVARALGLSTRHFIRQFEAVFGVTPHQFRIRARLDRAKRLLASSGRSVTAVCMDVGLASLGSFSGTFSRRIGMTPSSFRATARADVAAALFPGCLSLLGHLPADAVALSEKRAGSRAGTMRRRQGAGRCGSS